MTRHTKLVRVMMFAVCLVGPIGEAAAQSTGGNPWGVGTLLFGFVGAGRPVETSAALGAGIGWELVPFLTLEGRGTWFPGGNGADAFTALLGARVPLLPGRQVVPFVSGSVGFNRASFDSAAAAASAPEFYRRRLPASGQSETFDDFAMAVAGGADVFVTRHFALRPELSLVVVRGPSDSRVVPVYGVNLSYHFEEHIVTPARWRSAGRRLQ